MFVFIKTGRSYSVPDCTVSYLKVLDLANHLKLIHFDLLHDSNNIFEYWNKIMKFIKIKLNKFLFYFMAQI